MLGLLVSFLPASCPPDMVFATPTTCIDRLPFPNYEGEGPMLGLSAVVEPYLRLDGATWDAETLCASRGKRVCAWEEWQSACEGTVVEACPPVVAYIAPDWGLVTSRDPFELLRLDQHASPDAWPACRGQTGARMMGNVQEWVRHGKGHAFSRGFWSRPADCHSLNTAHDEKWHDYATGTRCCSEVRHDLRLPLLP